MRRTLFLLAASTCLVPAAHAAEIMPLDRATILAGSPFDMKVEFDGVVKPGDVSVTINGEPAAGLLGKDATFIEREEGVDASAVRIDGVSIATPGSYTVEAKAGDETKSVTWDVYGTPGTPVVKNVIFMIADGLSVADRTTARLMSKGMTGGKADGRLNMDDLDYAAFIGTSSTGSIATDSANTASAYMTGHKTAVNALGVYADRTEDTLDDPKVELISEALRRTGGKSVGIVSTAEIEDATPAALIAHTRKRADKPEIADMLLAHQPEVILGGGSAYFLPRSTPGSKRKDDENLVEKFQDAGYALATDAEGLKAAGGSNSGRILGLFHTGNMDTALDRKFLGKGTVQDFPNQPGLVEMTRVAIDQLAKDPDGFFVMIEAATVDKMKHPMDWERAMIDTIEFDQAVGVARDFVAAHPDTLLVVTGDHTHGNSLIGTIDPARGEGRESVGVYADAGFLGYRDENGDGYPDDLNVAPRIAMFSNNFPDYYETWGPKLDDPFEPAVKDENGDYVANAEYKDVPGAVLREGNLPKSADTAVHAVDDVVLQASGAGAEKFHGYMEQSDVYRVIAELMALAPAKPGN
ncbi:alkaline phosphatase [Amaricoccus solimangrovi]|uniref:Alkaline phosphatase n=1 Tax=Amaricoccus solimangrovi TaxID=2589815 RepID=A0A501WKI8_9RHOB|nr:alkaline phosphatase [Amaricoccus solimangrovi]TPE49868.1 alkaline phosphatase [Amaricoccus solimangrovi]